MDKTFLIIILVSAYLSEQLTDAFEPVAFSAIKGGRNENYVSLTTMVINNSADFNNLYSAFRCRSPGLYFFTFTALTQPGKELRLSLRVTKVNLVTVYGKSSNPVTLSGSMLVPLEEGDLVYLFIEAGELNESNQINQAYTTFTGLQISENKNGGFLSGILGGRSSSKSFVNSHLADENDRILELIDSQ